MQARRVNVLIAASQPSHHSTLETAFRKFFDYYLLPFLVDAQKRRIEEDARYPCKKYQASLPLSEWKNFPSGIVWGGSHPLLEGFNDPEVDRTDKLPQALADWRAQQRRELIEKFWRATQSQHGQNLCTDSHVLDLAVAVYSCDYCESRHWIGCGLVGWDRLLEHLCSQYYSNKPAKCRETWDRHSSLSFSSIGHEVAKALVRSVGLDPETATVQDMDARDARFFCGDSLDSRSAYGVEYRKALKWRECVSSSFPVMVICPVLIHTTYNDAD